MQPAVLNTLRISGFVFLSIIAGFFVGHRLIYTASGELYQIVGISSDGNTQLGFACICANHYGTKSWEGYIGDGCSGTNSPDKAINLSQTPSRFSLNGYAVPGGACCRPQPRVGNITIPNLPGCG